MLNKKLLLKNYPKQAGNRFYYVRWPIQNDAGKWVAVNVCLPTGYNRLAAPHEFDNEKECQKACDIENAMCGFDKKAANVIIQESMDNVDKPLLECDQCGAVFVKRSSRHFKCPTCGAHFTHEYKAPTPPKKRGKAAAMLLFMFLLSLSAQAQKDFDYTLFTNKLTVISIKDTMPNLIVFRQFKKHGNTLEVIDFNNTADASVYKVEFLGIGMEYGSHVLVYQTDKEQITVDPITPRVEIRGKEADRTMMFY